MFDVALFGRCYLGFISGLLLLESLIIGYASVPFWPVLLDLRTVAAGNESGLSQVSVAPYFPALLAFTNCASAYLENFEIAHIGSEDFEIRHIACEAMIRAPWRFRIASVSSRHVRSDFVALSFEGATHTSPWLAPAAPG